MQISFMDKLETQIALRFAETMLYWRGHLRAKEVQDFLRVSERTARSLIGNWRRFDALLPPYLATAERRLVPTEEFDPGPAVTDPNAALSLILMADGLPGNPFSPVAPLGGGHDLALTASVPSRATREVLAACLDRQAVWVIYAAKIGLQEFVFHPSALIRCRGRYHLRGYRAAGREVSTGATLDQRYVDMIPARTVEAQRKTDTAFIGLDGDEDWQAFEKAQYVLSPALSAEERLCYEHEYGIADSGVLRVKQRRALMPYVRQELAERRCWRRDGTSVRIWKTMVS